MKSDGLRMDRMTHGLVMFLHSRNGEWEACLRVYEDMGKVWGGVRTGAVSKLTQFCRSGLKGVEKTWFILLVAFASRDEIKYIL